MTLAGIADEALREQIAQWQATNDERIGAALIEEFMGIARGIVGSGRKWYLSDCELDDILSECKIAILELLAKPTLLNARDVRAVVALRIRCHLRNLLDAERTAKRLGISRQELAQVELGIDDSDAAETCGAGCAEDNDQYRHWLGNGYSAYTDAVDEMDFRPVKQGCC